MAKTTAETPSQHRIHAFSIAKAETPERSFRIEPSRSKSDPRRRGSGRAFYTKSSATVWNLHGNAANDTVASPSTGSGQKGIFPDAKHARRTSFDKSSIKSYDTETERELKVKTKADGSRFPGGFFFCSDW